MPPFLLNLLPYILAAGVAIGALTGAYFKGSHDNEAEWQAKIAQQKIEALQKEAEWKGKIDAINDQHKTEVGAVNKRLDAALVSLRNRSETRLSGIAGTSCAGATGKELARADGEFLARYAADAARLQVDLNACKAYINTVRK